MFLKIHPHSQGGAGIQIEGAVTRPSSSNGLILSYVVRGAISDILIPEQTTSQRADGLWQHTCFEAFLGTSGTEYYEFNFAPTTQWAAYRFSGYRNDRSLAVITPPLIKVNSGTHRYSLQATLSLASWDREDFLSWRIGLSAVIEDRSGRMSYWALVHPEGKPDFHRSETFTYDFSADAQ